MQVRLIILALVLLALVAGCAEEDRQPPETAVRETSTAGSLNATTGSDWVPVPEGFEPLPGAQAYFGLFEGAAFRIEMPSDWNGDLVLWAHGFRAYGPEVRAETPPLALRQAIIASGFAWAATSFSQNGYAPSVFADETLALKRYFAGRFRPPSRSYIAGESMGGHVTVLSLERFPEEYDGGLSLCGVVAGQEWWDYLVAWALAAEFISGSQFPLEDGTTAVSQALESKVLPALGTPESPTLAGEAFASVIRNLTGGPRPFFQDGLQEAFAFNFGLITGDPGRRMPLTQAASTIEVDYQADPGLGFDGEVINRGVRRLAGDAALRDPSVHPDTAPTTGHLQDPLLTLHETGDLTVPISMEQSYRAKVESVGRGEFLVQRAIRGAGHCKFSADELVAAWDAITLWVGGGSKPPGDDLLQDLSNAGRPFTVPDRPGDTER